MKTLKALRRLWKLAICNHSGAANWSIVIGETEMHFCRVCGRLLVACDPSDQPQHNSHWLERDHLDHPLDRHRIRLDGSENQRLTGQLS